MNTKKYEYCIYRISITFQGKEAVDKGIEIGLKLQKAYGNTSKGAREVLLHWFEENKNNIDKSSNK